MQASYQSERTLTELDSVRLETLLRRHAAASAESPLMDLLEAAERVPSRQVDPDVVTMYSQVLLADPDGRRRKLTLCYPADAEPDAGFVSVLSPIGASLLGRRVGATARWRSPSGAVLTAEVLALLFQPESTGDYTL